MDYWLVALLGAGGVVLLLLLGLISQLLQFGQKENKTRRLNLKVDLEAIPPPPPLTGDRRLLVEGVPVRLRLVVLAPAGRAYEINPAGVNQILERVKAGLGKIAEDDKPWVRIWPSQLSYEGFSTIFQANTPTPEGEKEPSRWALVSGRAHLGTHHVMVGLAMQAINPTTVGRLRLDSHDWDSILRIRTRE